MTHNYDDAFRDVMHYVEMNLDKRETRIQIRDQRDLRELFLRLDRERPGGKPRMSAAFINAATNSNAAKQRVGSTAGRRGRIFQYKR